MIFLEALLFNAYNSEDHLMPEYDDVPVFIEELMEIDHLLRVWWQ